MLKQLQVIRFKNWLPHWMDNGWFVIHLGLTLIIGWWAVILASPEQTFATGSSYNEFVKICPDERYWAVGFAIAAIVGGIGCWESWPSKPISRYRNIIRSLSAFTLGINHGLIALLTYRGNPAGTGTGVYIVCMLMAYLLALAEVDRIE